MKITSKRASLCWFRTPGEVYKIQNVQMCVDDKLRHDLTLPPDNLGSGQKLSLLSYTYITYAFEVIEVTPF